MPPDINRRPTSRSRRGGANGVLRFFFYGTLCDADVRAAVIGRPIDVAPAILGSHEAVPAARGRFPILLFQTGREAAGVVCDGVTVAEAARLGFYEHEGRDYTARAFEVRADRGGMRAWIFVPTGTLRRGPGRWDLAEWQRFAKADFLARVRSRMRALEANSLARELDPLIELWRGRAEAA